MTAGRSLGGMTHADASTGWENRTFRSLPAIEDLLQAKEANRFRISVVLPALDEAATIGQICRTIGTELMEDAPLVDELSVSRRVRGISLDLGVSGSQPVQQHTDGTFSQLTLSGTFENLIATGAVYAGQDTVAVRIIEATELRPDDAVLRAIEETGFSSSG